MLLDFKHISFSASSHLHLAGEVERIVAFSCSCYAWIGSLCKAEVFGGQQGPAPLHALSAAHGIFLTRRQHWLLGLSMLSPCGVAEWSSCSSSSFSCISRNIKEKTYKEENSKLSRWLTAYRIQTPKARLKASARLTAINSKMSALFLLDRFVTFPLTSLHHLFYWDCLLWKKIPTGRYYGEIWQQQRGSCLKWPEVMPGFPQCLHCPQHCIVAGGMCEWVLRHRSETRLRGSSRSCSPFSSSLEKLHQSKATGIKSY